MPFILILYGVLVTVTACLHGSATHRRRYTFSKTLTSLGFVVIALFAGYRGDFPSLYLYLLPGFWFAVAGDYLLGLAHSENNYRGKTFLLGATAFMLAHVSFYLAYSAEYAFRWSDWLLPCVFAGVMFFILHGKKFNLGRMKVPGLIYSFFVTVLLSKGISLFVYEGWAVRHLLVLLSGFFFLASDIVLLFMYFYVSPSKKRLGAVNLVTYYIAMGLLGLSIFPN
ncbi:MAG: hypothetical protein GX099_00365 [Clostridiaceae bacterium]|jgi:uncharacterized membrane protein YhhN|nr:hypothetical protein [Clostridiaceae bacterium]